MEDAVADPHDQRAKRERHRALREAHDQDTQRQDRHAADQDVAAADAVDQEPGQRLQHGRGDRRQHDDEADH